MKTYNYFYYGEPITKINFLKNVHKNWESEVNEFGEYSSGGFRAVERN